MSKQKEELKPMGEYYMNKIKDLMDVNYRSHVPMLLIGYPGVGKTEIIKQKASELLGAPTYIDEYTNLPKLDHDGKPVLDKDNNVVTEKKPVYIMEPDGVTPRLDKNGHKIIHKIEHYATSKDGFNMIDCSNIAEEGYCMPYLNQYDKKHPLHRAMLAEFDKLKSWLNDPVNNGKTAIFFIDEFTSASPDDQRTLMNFINGGIFPDGSTFDLSRVFFILAGNPSSSMPGYSTYDGATNNIEEAVITRCMTYFVGVDRNEFLEWGQQLDPNGRHNIHPYLISALENDSKEFMKEETGLDVRVMNPRTLKKLSDYLYACDDMSNNATNGKTYRWERAAVEAAIGKPAAASVIMTLSSLDNMVTIKDLFGNPKSKHLNKDKVKEFEALPAFQQTYIALLTIDDVMGIDYTKLNNYYKLSELLDLNFQSKESIKSVLNAIFNGPEGSIASVVQEIGMNYDKYGIPRNNSLVQKVVDNARDDIALEKAMQ